MDTRICRTDWGELVIDKDSKNDKELNLEIPEFMTRDYRIKEAALNLCVMAHDCQDRNYRTHKSDIAKLRNDKSRREILFFVALLLALLIVAGIIEGSSF